MDKQKVFFTSTDFVPQDDLEFVWIYVCVFIGMVTIAGWGLTRSQGQPNSSLADVLQTTPTLVIPNKEFQELIDKNTEHKFPMIYSSEVCIGWEDGRANSCHGDSGGPMVTTINGKATLLGFSIKGSDGRLKCSRAGYL